MPPCSISCHTCCMMPPLPCNATLQAMPPLLGHATPFHAMSSPSVSLQPYHVMPPLPCHATPALPCHQSYQPSIQPSSYVHAMHASTHDTLILSNIDALKFCLNYSPFSIHYSYVFAVIGTSQPATSKQLWHSVLWSGEVVW